MPEDDFGSLDYQPKKKSKYLMPALIVAIVVVVSIVVFIIVLMGRNADKSGLGDEQGIEQEKQGQAEETAQDISGPVDAETDTAGEESDQSEEKDSIPPDYDLLETAIYSWLIDRIGDPAVIMVHTDELEDVEGFFERFSLEEDNVIVYQVQSTDDQFATVAFGLPYSEWSTRVVFIWRDREWSFLREETIQ